MINNTEFSHRLKKIMEHFALSSSAFADKIGVQRSSISHLLSGRNKPSLDFVLKVTNTFTEVDLYWLINGKGNFPKSGIVEQHQIQSSTTPISSNTPKTEDQKRLSIKQKQDKMIEKIVVFYTDGTFEEYEKA